tara:strand:+ start:40 stop:519 length:480 start_codon:yes stop_codon:yes gene_type:complete
MEIQGYPNYLIYSDGRVFSKNYQNTGKGKFMMTSKPRRGGYNQVGLSNNNFVKMMAIHRLVAIHYIPNPENKPEVDHINHIRHDNRIENLRWATCPENCDNKGLMITNTTGFKWICNKDKKGSYKFARKMNGKLRRKHSKSLPKLLCYSFFYLLKNPLP